jgi:hypothetical protein
VAELDRFQSTLDSRAAFSTTDEGIQRVTDLATGGNNNDRMPLTANFVPTMKLHKSWTLHSTQIAIKHLLHFDTLQAHSNTPE